MTREEARTSVMGAISMALKDPILQQGFEIICKENAEQNAQLTKAVKLIRNLLYAYQLGKNELATARVMAEAKEFLKEVEE